MMTNDKSNSTKQFANRLRDALISAGHDSDRSISGVNLQKLVEITGYSVQICRKYLRGETLPDIKKIIEIANELDVNPGWLLFGEATPENHTKTDITISKKLLHLILVRANELHTTTRSPHDIANFLISLTENVCQLSVDEQQATKIIDMAFSSAKHFSSLHSQ